VAGSVEAVVVVDATVEIAVAGAAVVAGGATATSKFSRKEDLTEPRPTGRDPEARFPLTTTLAHQPLQLNCDMSS
jgi:hypothetical protein